MIKSLQGLRGLSIFLVFCSHWFAAARSSNFLPANYATELAWLNVGKYGVDLFFMISGFVIAKSLMRHRDIVSFGIDRIARIYPVFLTLHLFIFTVGPLIHYRLFDDIGWLEWSWLFGANLLMLPGTFDLPIAQIVAWSLSYEVVFYALAAVTWLYRKEAPLKLVVVIFASLAFLWFHPRAVFFLSGVAAYLVCESRQWQQRWWSSLFGIGTFAGFLYFWGGLHPEDGQSLGRLLDSTADAFGFVVAVACATYFFFQILHDDGVLKRLIETPWLVGLGDISYSFYLLHVVVMFPLKRIADRFVHPLLGSEATFVLFGFSALIATVVLSRLSRTWLEVRMGQWLKRSLSDLRQRASASAEASR